ncbi:MAG: OmpA family protein [Bacteroidetes bacterium]|nr:OmpA family protein [Bacteroidota bacterium]
MKFSNAVAAIAAVICSLSGLYAQGGGKPAVTKARPPKEIAPAVQIYFDLNKYEVKKSEAEKLNKLINDLKSKKEYRIVLTGHTDSLGNDAYNMELSARRVDEVYDFLVEQGVDTGVLRKMYFGRAKPREKNEGDEEKRAKNRRVEITIIEKEKPVEIPKPPVKDTCGRDTLVFIGQGISISMNKCEYTRMCKAKPGSCITVERMTELDEIFDSGTPLKTQKGEGFIWGGIFKFAMAGDTCLKNPASFQFQLDLDAYKKAKLGVYKTKGESSLEMEKGTRVSITRTKEYVKVGVPLKCPGQINVASVAGKSKTAAFKDKSGKVEEVYVVTAAPVSILPATKKGSKWFVNYTSVAEPKMYLRLKDGETVVRDIDLNSVRKAKKKGELRKKYKIKGKHLKGA